MGYALPKDWLMLKILYSMKELGGSRQQSRKPSAPGALAPPTMAPCSKKIGICPWWAKQAWLGRAMNRNCPTPCYLKKNIRSSRTHDKGAKWKQNDQIICKEKICKCLQHTFHRTCLLELYACLHDWKACCNYQAMTSGNFSSLITSFNGPGMPTKSAPKQHVWMHIEWRLRNNTISNQDLPMPRCTREASLEWPGMWSKSLGHAACFVFPNKHPLRINDMIPPCPSNHWKWPSLHLSKSNRRSTKGKGDQRPAVEERWKAPMRGQPMCFLGKDPKEKPESPWL